MAQNPPSREEVPTKIEAAPAHRVADPAEAEAATAHRVAADPAGQEAVSSSGLLAADHHRDKGFLGADDLISFRGRTGLRLH